MMVSLTRKFTIFILFVAILATVLFVGVFSTTQQQEAEAEKTYTLTVNITAASINGNTINQIMVYYDGTEGMSVSSDKTAIKLNVSSGTFTITQPNSTTVFGVSLRPSSGNIYLSNMSCSLGIIRLR